MEAEMVPEICQTEAKVIKKLKKKEEDGAVKKRSAVLFLTCFLIDVKFLHWYNVD